MTATASGKYSIGDKNLALLSELIHKDAESYKDEFTEQLEHYLQTMKLLNLQPTLHTADLLPFLELINFLAQTASKFPKDAKQFAQHILSALRTHSRGLNPEIRLAFCKALVILRNKKITPPMELLEIMFELVKCEDKELRKYIFGSLVSYLRRLKTGKADRQLTNKTQAFLFAKLKDSRSIVARIAQLVLVDAFRKNLLRDAKTANAISECCFHSVSRIQVAALKFFLGSAKDEEGLEDDSLSEAEEGKEEQKTYKEIVTSFRAAKKTKKRLKDFEKAKKLMYKEKKKKKEDGGKFCNLFAIQNLYDPQTFSDRLFGMLESKKNEKFELRLLRIALCARVIGVHKLQTLSFYSYLHRYMQPKQREVTRLLLYAAQACHELVPPDIVERLVYVIAQNFVADHNTPEAITVGLNAIREIFANCPFAATEELLRDLTEYKKYKNKNVSMAARGLITLFRSANPHLLHRKDRGRPTEATKELDVREFGKQNAKSFVPGAECLPEEREDTGEAEVDNDDDLSSESSWVDLPESDEEEVGVEEADKEGVSGSENGWETNEGNADNRDEQGNKEDCEDAVSIKKSCLAQKRNTKTKKVSFDDLVDTAEVKEPELKAKEVSESRILTQEEFRKIHAYQIKKQIVNKKSKGTQKRKLDDEKLDMELEEKIARRSEGDGLPRLNDIEHFHKKLQQTKEEKIRLAEEGRSDKDIFKKPKKTGPHVGRTNRELAKKKAFQMVRPKIRGKNRKRSFKEQQTSLRKYLLRQAGRKV